MIGARPRVLWSYWYGRRFPPAQLQGLTDGWDVILDSGAFSAHSSGQDVDLDAYADWVRAWRGRATAAFSLDVIGDPVASAANYQRLIDMDLGVTVIPVFHAGSAARHLDAILEAGAPYVGFGGLVAHFRNKTAVLRWAAWNLRRCADAGVRVHGLGMTAGHARDLPFYSVDSSTWTMGPRRGFAVVWDERRRRPLQVMYRDPQEVQRYARELTRFGVDPARIAAPGFMREDTRAGDARWLLDTAARAFLAMDDHLRARHQVPAPAGLDPELTGTKVYMACTTLPDMDRVAAAWAAHTPERTPA
ncbi:hypothetical protein [Streptomyces sp. NPDC049879]|uniref:hypothetical protein n=1 Tax=Streptomyces sp. NPDC049879 TaxID=3365598 RepID=UPI0037B823F6